MGRDRVCGGTAIRFVLLLASCSGLAWAVPAQARPGPPPPTVTITTEPMLGQSPPQTLRAAWTIDRAGAMATLRVSGDVLAHTTVVALWTSAPHLIKHYKDSGALDESWDVDQAPIGARSQQSVSSRETKPRGGWGPWGDETPDVPYSDSDPLSFPAQSRDLWYDGPTLPHGQVQYRLVLTLEPGTHINEQVWNVAG